MSNQFLTLASQITESDKGALKFTTTNNPFVDQMALFSTYKSKRDVNLIDADAKTLWDIDPQTALKFAFYMRTISRKTNVMMDSNVERLDDSQIGGGLRYESLNRIYWMALQNPKVLENNLALLVSAGSVKDIFELMEIDYIRNSGMPRLDWSVFTTFIIDTIELSKDNAMAKQFLFGIKKYMPRVDSTKKAITVDKKAKRYIQRYIMSYLGYSFQDYRQFKSETPNGHVWQQLISNRKFKDIDFGKIHGRALYNLVNSKFLDNNELMDKYEKWIENTSTVKYTGYPHELFKNYNSNIKRHTRMTIDKQFMTLVNAVKTDNNVTDMIVVRDTSGSMGSLCDGKMSCYDVSKALALYFSYFLKGEFADAWIEFADRAVLHTWKGSTPTERWDNDKTSYVGTTNFLNVLELFAKLKQRGIPESDFPKGILCISDTEYDAANDLQKTNVEAARNILRKAGFSDTYVDEFKIVLWNMIERYGSAKYEVNTDQERNVFYLSGFDGAAIKFVMSGEVVKEGNVEKNVSTPKNNAELLSAMLNQKLLNMIRL